jgi:hypothetical protein
VKALLGRIVCDGGIFVEEFIGRDPLSPWGFSWVRDKGAAHDFKSAMVADACRIGNAYTASDGRLRFPMVICGESEPVRVFPSRMMRRHQQTAPAEVFAETERRFEPQRHQEHQGRNYYE